MKQLYHPYTKWEDKKNGMYDHISLKNESFIIDECISLLVDRKAFYSIMKEVSTNWKHSAETNLSNPNNNRRAWLGRASCCYKHKAPENITQKAWVSMTKEQRENANKTADTFLSMWESSQVPQLDLFGDTYA